ncbi:GumC family protein [Fretibacter rubidus]|uniref:GumC family protein n=1 Tax=Fretibacter rubidus TaxID=570162 RepID=UPI00352A97C0
MAILGLGKRKKGAAVEAAPRPMAEPSPRVGDLTVGDYANGMPRIRLGEFFNSFGRQLRWVIPLMVLGTLGTWYMTKDIKRTYTGEGRILVQLGSEYVFQDPTNQNASQGLMLTPDHIVLNEIGIMKNADIIEKVVGEMTSSDSFGPGRFAKDAFEKINGARNPVDEQNAWVDLYKEVESSFAVMPQPKSSIVDLAYKHEDPEVAVETLNAFIEEYLNARKALFVEGSGDVIAERRKSTEEQLKTNERAMQRFLQRYGISDFESERTGVTKRTEDLRTELNTLRGSLSEAERALATVENQLRSTDETMDLYVDDRTSQRVAAAELELKQLLAKFLPGSQPVRQKQIELQELKSLQTSGNGRVAGGRRVGPNPVFQELMTRRNTLQAQADSLREKEFTLP